MNEEILLQLTAERLMEFWLVDTPIARLVSEPLSKITYATLKGLVKSSNVRLIDQDKLIRKVFAVPKELKDSKQAADYVAKMIIDWLPEEISTIGKAMQLKEGEITKSDEKQEPVDKNGNKITKQELLELIRNNPIFKNSDSQDKFKKWLDSMFSISAVRVWDGSTLERVLKEIVKRLAANERVAAKLKYELGSAMLSLSRREPIAIALSSADVALQSLQSVKSSGMIGISVHKYLQDLYIKNYKEHTIVAEKNVYDNGLLVGNIKKLAWNYTHSDFFALMMARFSPFSPSGDIRDDVADYTSGDIWEIKPMKGAAQGVCQEIFYSTSYNCFCIFLENVFSWPAIRKRFTDGNGWREDLLRYFVPSGLKGSPVYIKPFCIDQIPGLVLYLVIKGISPELIEALFATLIALLLNYLRSEIERLKKFGDIIWEGAKKIWNTIEETIQAIVQAISHFLPTLVMMVGLLIVISSGAAAPVIINRIMVFPIMNEESQKNAPSPLDIMADAKTKNSRLNIILGNCIIQGLPSHISGQYLSKVSNSVSVLLNKSIKAGLDKANELKSDKNFS